MAADGGKIGKPWSDDELDAIVADYFAMLKDEIAGVPYVKSHHSAALMSEIGRTHRSVEFKHQNISAVLEEMGMPWIRGYKPKRNYQGAILGAIERHLLRDKSLTNFQTPAVSQPPGVSLNDIFVSPPQIVSAPPRPPELQRLIRKFDPVERDFRNRELGKAGEELVLNVERRALLNIDRPDLSKKVRWISAEQGDGAGYDILSFDHLGNERLIEVKTTNGAAKTPFFLTRTEHDVANERADAWRIYRVHLFAQSPKIFTIAPPLASTLELNVESWRASFTRRAELSDLAGASDDQR